MLAAFDRMDGDSGFAAGEERLLEAFAASAATAVVTAQRVAASTLTRRVEAAEHERARWARELHDESLQDLAGLKILLAAGRRREAGDLPAVVDEAIDRLSQSIESLRGLIADLRPAALDQLGVGAALEGLAERTRAQRRARGRAARRHRRVAPARRTRRAPSTGSCRRRSRTSPSTPTHARVAIVVQMEPGGVDIQVSDDGAGFDPATPAAGFGLVGMRERVEIAHGSLDVEAAAGAGTLVRAHIPLDRRGRVAERDQRLTPRLSRAPVPAVSGRVIARCSAWKSSSGAACLRIVPTAPSRARGARAPATARRPARPPG